jgi:His-Xaa-Ser system protein HxsD
MMKGEGPPSIMPVESSVRVLHIDESLYHKSAVLRACYWFTDRCYLFVARPAPGQLDVQVRAKTGTDAEDLEAVVGEFANALLDYELRRQIDDQTGKIRELLVAKAVAQVGTLDDPPPGSANDPVEDRQAAFTDFARSTRGTL